MVWIVVLTVFGLALIVAEVFFPSMGVLSILSGVCLVSAVMLGFQEGQATGFVVLVAAVAAVPLAIFYALKLLPRTSIGRNLVLDATVLPGEKQTSQEPGLEALMGRRGRSLSTLRPAGFARIDGRRIDVVTRGEMIEADTAVVVVEVEANRVVVSEDAATDSTAGAH